MSATLRRNRVHGLTGKTMTVHTARAGERLAESDYTDQELHDLLEDDALLVIVAAEVFDPIAWGEVERCMSIDEKGHKQQIEWLRWRMVEWARARRRSGTSKRVFETIDVCLLVGEACNQNYVRSFLQAIGFPKSERDRYELTYRQARSVAELMRATFWATATRNGKGHS